MRRRHNRLSWAATPLIAVAYAHVILGIAAAIPPWLWGCGCCSSYRCAMR